MSRFCSLVMIDTLNPQVSAPGAMFERRDPELLSISCVHCDRTLTVLCSHLFPPETSNLEFKKEKLGFPGGAVVEILPANAGDTGSSPGLGGSHMPQIGRAHV